MLSNILDRISFYALFLVIVLLPVFFLPFTNIPVEISKSLLLVFGMVISIVFWIAARFSDGQISIPWSKPIMALLVLLLVTLASALFSGASNVSMFGTILDLGTFYYMLTAFLLLVFSALFFKNIHNAKKVFWGVIIVSTLLFLFQTLRFFFPEALSLGVLGGKTDNILGAWNSFGLFAGFSTIMSLFVIEFFPISRIMKWLLGALIIFSIFVSAFVNFPLVWKLLGVFALIIFVYKVSLSLNKSGDGEEPKKKQFPVFSFVVVMVSLLFFVSGQYIGGLLPNKFGISYVEVGPSFSATFDVAKDALWQNPVLGAGPNNFSKSWAMYKPEAINTTEFWDTSFGSGASLILTLALNTGILGILSWILFFLFFFLSGFHALFTSIKNNTNWEKVAFFVASFYLFVAAILYSAGSVILLLAFAFTGIFLGLTFGNKEGGEISFSFLDDPRKSFFSILALVVLMIITAGVGFKFGERVASVSYFRQTLVATEIGNAERSIRNAVVLYQNDLYLRTYAQVYLTKINSLVSGKESNLSDEEKKILQDGLDQAVKGAEMAVNYDKDNYLNYNSLGNVYGSLGVLGVEGAHEKAIEAYKQSMVLNPLNPGIRVALASTYLRNKNTSEARASAEESLKLKADYVDGLVTLAQIERTAGNSRLAISYAEKALAILPNNEDLKNYVSALRSGAPVETPVDLAEGTNKDEVPGNLKKQN